MTQSNSMK